MAYTQNESIDGLTTITPTTDDLVVTMDQAEVGVAKTSTLLSIYNLFKTTYDTLYAKYSGDADFYKYRIVTSVASGNLTVSLKNYLGNDPTALAPVKVQIGDTVRTVTSGLSKTLLSTAFSYYNLGSLELANKEVDMFLYLGYRTASSSVELGFARFPYAKLGSDFAGSSGNEKDIYWTNAVASTDSVVCIGRFNCIYSGSVWILPTTSIIINNPIYETRELDYTVGASALAPLTFTITTTTYARYKIIGSTMIVKNRFVGTTGGSAGSVITHTLPFSPKYTFQSGAGLIYDGGADDISGYTKNPSTVGEIRVCKYDSSNYGIGAGRVAVTNEMYQI